MKTLSYHEGIPGHHFQIATARELKGLPFIRQQPIYTAYAEGWALYAERLAAEIGLYRDDPFGDLGRLQAEMFRAVRLVVDTGLHAKGWTREQAIEYMVSTTGMGESEVTSEVERYMALPGQALAYKVGQLKILELRDEARAALGRSSTSRTSTPSCSRTARCRSPCSSASWTSGSKPSRPAERPQHMPSAARRLSCACSESFGSCARSRRAMPAATACARRPPACRVEQRHRDVALAVRHATMFANPRWPNAFEVSGPYRPHGLLPSIMPAE